MTINIRKHTSSIHQVGGESIVLKQNTKSNLRVISRSCTLLFIFMALCGLTMAQSTDPANPTPITSNQVEGKATGAGATYYYRFKAHKGSVRVTLVGQTNNYSTQFEADLLDSDGKDLGDIYVSAGDQLNHAFKDFSFDSDQSVNIVVKLTKDDTLKWQKYSIMLSGAVDFGEQGGGNKESSSPAIPANSSPALPDLIVSDVQIGGNGGDKATVFVSNVCNGNVTADSIRVRLTVYNGPDKSSGEGPFIEGDLAPLAGNTSSKITFPLALPSLKSFKGRYLRVDIDPKNLIKETVKTNNWWELCECLPFRTGAAPFPSPPDSCKPKSPSDSESQPQTGDGGTAGGSTTAGAQDASANAASQEASASQPSDAASAAQSSAAGGGLPGKAGKVNAKVNSAGATLSSIITSAGATADSVKSVKKKKNAHSHFTFKNDTKSEATNAISNNANAQPTLLIDSFKTGAYSTPLTANGGTNIQNGDERELLGGSRSIYLAILNPDTQPVSLQVLTAKPALVVNAGYHAVPSLQLAYKVPPVSADLLSKYDRFLIDFGGLDHGVNLNIVVYGADKKVDGHTGEVCKVLAPDGPFTLSFPFARLGAPEVLKQTNTIVFEFQATSWGLDYAITRITAGKGDPIGKHIVACSR